MHGKRIVLTGASEGIGHGLALALAREGARVVIAARNADKLQAVVDACAQLPGEVFAVPTDVGDQAACQHLIETASTHLGGLDILINNAGISMSTRFDELEDLAIFERLMRVNYLGTVYCTYYALPLLRATRGLIVGVSSLQGKTGFPRSTGYAGSKHAVQGFLDSLRLEIETQGVAVLVVSPGPVDTKIHARKLDKHGVHSDSGQDFSDKKQMSVEECSRQIIQAMRRRKRELVMTAGGKLAVWLKPFVPRFVDRQIARAVENFYAD